jgi:Cytochrome C'
VRWEGGFLRTARFRGPGLESAVRAKFPCRTLITKAINLIAALAGRGAGRWLIGFACIESGARKHLVAEAGKLLAAVDRGDKEAISQQVVNTRKACSACHQLFRD